MTELEQLGADLGFVRDAVKKSDTGRSVASIHLLWAVIVPVGFAMMDFAPAYVPIYWTIAGPGGFLLSGLLGWKSAAATGQMDRARGNREALHWGSMLVTIFLAVPLVATNRISQDDFGMFVTLVLALAYLLAGVHLYRPLLWVGVLVMFGYGGLWILPAYRWTTIGVLASAALIVTALMSRPQATTDG